MTNRAKAKGSSWERRLVDYLNLHGFPFAERRVTEGAKDRGDVSGVPFVIEAKNCKAITIGPWCDEAAKEARTAGMGNRWAVVFPRRNHVTEKAYAVVSLETLTELMRLARATELAERPAGTHRATPQPEGDA